MSRTSDQYTAAPRRQQTESVLPKTIRHFIQPGHAVDTVITPFHDTQQLLQLRGTSKSLQQIGLVSLDHKGRVSLNKFNQYIQPEHRQLYTFEKATFRVALVEDDEGFFSFGPLRDYIVPACVVDLMLYWDDCVSPWLRLKDILPPKLKTLFLSGSNTSNKDWITGNIPYTVTSLSFGFMSVPIHKSMIPNVTELELGINVEAIFPRCVFPDRLRTLKMLYLFSDGWNPYNNTLILPMNNVLPKGVELQVTERLIPTIPRNVFVTFIDQGEYNQAIRAVKYSYRHISIDEDVWLDRIYNAKNEEERDKWTQRYQWYQEWQLDNGLINVIVQPPPPPVSSSSSVPIQTQFPTMPPAFANMMRAKKLNQQQQLSLDQ